MNWGLPHHQRNKWNERKKWIEGPLTLKEMKEIPPHTLKEMKEIISIVAWVKSQRVPGMTQAHLKQHDSYYWLLRGPMMDRREIVPHLLIQNDRPPATVRPFLLLFLCSLFSCPPCRSASARLSSASSANRRSSSTCHASASARHHSASAQCSSSSCAAANALNISSSSLATSASTRCRATCAASSFVSMSLLVIVVVVVIVKDEVEKKICWSQKTKTHRLLYVSHIVHGPQGSVLRGEYCYMPVRELCSTSFSVIPVTSLSLFVTIVSPSYLSFVIVTLRLFVFCPSFHSSSRIYSTPIMFRASFLGFVAGLSYFNISTFLWLDNKIIVFVILWLIFLVVLRYFTWSTFFTVTSIMEYIKSLCFTARPQFWIEQDICLSSTLPLLSPSHKLTDSPTLRVRAQHIRWGHVHHKPIHRQVPWSRFR